MQHYIYLKPLELREVGAEPLVDGLGIWCNDINETIESINIIKALESGRYIYICSTPAYFVSIHFILAAMKIQVSYKI
jgi:hypothetical protein